MLYACGSNGNGQLGLGHFEDVSSWEPVDMDFSGHIELVGGGNHTVIIETDSGRVWSTQNAKFTPLIHPDGGKWKLASAGWSFIILVDTEDRIWSLGSGRSGELGLRGVSEVNELTRLPFKTPTAKSIKQMHSGMRHTVFSTDDGVLFGWGGSRKSQCGHEESIVAEPTMFPPTADRAMQFACGRDFTIVLRASGKVEIFGDTCRFDNSVDKGHLQADPHSDLIAGWSNFVVGDKIYGTINHNDLVLPPGSHTSRAMGSEHVLWVEGDTVYTSGWGEHGNCPPPCAFRGQIQVFGGCATSFVYTRP